MIYDVSASGQDLWWVIRVPVGNLMNFYRLSIARNEDLSSVIYERGHLLPLLANDMTYAYYGRRAKFILDERLTLQYDVIDSVIDFRGSWEGYKLNVLSQTAFDAITTKDATTFYFVSG